MPAYTVTIRGVTYSFADLKDVMAKASPRRSGDELAGVAASDARQRVAAQWVLADVPLRRFLEEPLVQYDQDEVTRLILDTHDRKAFAAIENLKRCVNEGYRFIALGSDQFFLGDSCRHLLASARAVLQSAPAAPPSSR